MKLYNKPRRGGYFLKGCNTYVYEKAIPTLGGWFIDTSDSYGPRYYIDEAAVVERLNHRETWVRIYQDPDESFDNALAWLAASLLTGAIK